MMTIKKQKLIAELFRDVDGNDWFDIFEKCADYFYQSVREELEKLSVKELKSLYDEYGHRI